MEDKKENTLISARSIVKFLAIAAFIIASFNFGKGVFAASLYFSPASGSRTVGGSLSVEVYVSSQDQAINAASGEISFPEDKLAVTSLSKSGSILNVWVKDPSYSNSQGTVNFEGVVLNPGYSGENGEIITVVFKVKAAGTAALSFSSGSVLANDGSGTSILSSLGTASFSFAKPAPAAVKPPPVLPAPVTQVIPVPAATTTPVIVPIIVATTTPSAPIAVVPATPAVPPSPLITSFPSHLSDNEVLVVRGKASPDTNLIIWLQKEGGDSQNFKTASDKNGDFIFVDDKKFDDGIYQLWAEAVNENGVAGNPSSESIIVIGQIMTWKIGSWSADSVAAAVIIPETILLLALLLWYQRERRKSKRLRRDIHWQIENLEKIWSKRPITAAERKIISRLGKDIDSEKK
jgi:hypothetical protein